MSKRHVIENFKNDLLTLHRDDLYFVLSVILPIGSNINKFISKLENEKATI
jgi:hypothetical protein